jgi:hypothetical protein
MNVWIVLSIFLLLVGSVAAISYYASTDYKGVYSILNVSSISVNNGNITGVQCIVYNSGGADCSA